MSNFLTSSIGRKFLMSITGLFLVMFIAVHLGVNLLLIFDDSGELFNLGAHFMATNPLIKIMEPFFRAGFYDSHHLVVFPGISKLESTANKI
jgi:succinate dehydrogenase / fumarate reductase, cytochrome b subunit